METKVKEDNVENLVIIGSGPAGYTAAIYAARADLSPLLYTGMEPGGQLTTTTDVDNFPGYPNGVDGPTMMVELQKQAERFGTEVRIGHINKVELTKKLDYYELQKKFDECRFIFIPNINDASPRVITESLCHNIPCLVNQNIIGGWKYKPNLFEKTNTQTQESISNTHSLGQILYTDYIHVFQISGMILLVAMIGAITLTFKKRENIKKQNYFDQIKREKEDAVSLVEVESDVGVKIDD